MINEFNDLTLRELFLIRIRHFNHLDLVQKFKIIWAIDKARERKLNFNFYSDKNTDVFLNSQGEGVALCNFYIIWQF